MASTTTNIKFNDRSRLYTITSNGKTYYIEKPSGMEGQLVGLKDNGLVYVTHGELWTVDPNNEDSGQYMQWDNKSVAEYMVTTSYKMSDGTTQNVIHLMGTDRDDPSKFGETIQPFRGYYFDPKLFGSYQVGIYLRYKGANEHGMMVLAPVSGVQVDEGSLINTHDFFKLPSTTELKSGPYHFYG